MSLPIVSPKYMKIVEMEIAGVLNSAEDERTFPNHLPQEKTKKVPGTCESIRNGWEVGIYRSYDTELSYRNSLT